MVVVGYNNPMGMVDKNLTKFELVAFLANDQSFALQCFFDHEAS